jgi:adenosylcobinamide-phosphate synthase
MLKYDIIALCAAYLLDVFIGDPQDFPHIVRLFGKLIALLEKSLYPLKNKRFGGSLLVIIVLLVCASVPFVILRRAWIISPWLFTIIDAFLCFQCIAATSLRKESYKVYKELKNGDINKARRAVSMIVGRDTANLDERGITRAAVETVAENTSDGITAPLMFIALFGGVGGCLYKAINTMDSMLGYKNEKYIDFGRAAAKLDDLANFIPSRICALLMIFAVKLRVCDTKNAYKIWRRDRLKHTSPNSAQTEAVMAGALNVQLAGSNYYDGKLVEKPYIGDDNREIECEDILRSHKILAVTAFLSVIVALLIKGAIYAIL